MRKLSSASQAIHDIFRLPLVPDSLEHLVQEVHLATTFPSACPEAQSTVRLVLHRALPSTQQARLEAPLTYSVSFDLTSLAQAASNAHVSAKLASFLFVLSSPTLCSHISLRGCLCMSMQKMKRFHVYAELAHPLRT